MSHFDSSYQTYDAPPPERKTSALAVASLVCSLIIFCPITTIAAPLLGLSAIISITANPMERKGKGMALSGIVIGLLATVGQGTLVIYAKNRSIRMMNNFTQVEIPTSIQAGYANDPVTFRSAFVGKATNATDEEVAVFISELQQQFGSLKSIRIDENIQSEDITLSRIIPCPVIIEFDTGEYRGKLYITGAGTLFDRVLKLDAIEFTGTDGNVIRFPYARSNTQ